MLAVIPFFSSSTTRSPNNVELEVNIIELYMAMMTIYLCIVSSLTFI